MDNSTSNNQAVIIGSIEEEFKLNHEIYAEKFYTFTLRIPRLSGAYDDIKVMISERLIMDGTYSVGDKVEINGQFRSYNCNEPEKNHLVLTVFARDIAPYCDADAKNPNQLYLNGYICKEPIYRKTPLGREIADLLIAVNRSYGKSDYIPCICWGRNARFASGFEVGGHVQVWGRIQSREYVKKLSETETEKRIAYEVSVSKIDFLEEE